MLRNNILIILILLFFQTSYVLSEEKFLSLKKDKVNVRYGPSFDFPIKYIYKKKNLPIKQIDEKENFRRIIDFKKMWLDSFISIKSNSVLNDKILLKNQYSQTSCQY